MFQFASPLSGNWQQIVVEACFVKADPAWSAGVNRNRPYFCPIFTWGSSFPQPSERTLISRFDHQHQRPTLHPVGFFRLPRAFARVHADSCGLRCFKKSSKSANFFSPSLAVMQVRSPQVSISLTIKINESLKLEMKMAYKSQLISRYKTGLFIHLPLVWGKDEGINKQMIII